MIIIILLSISQIITIILYRKKIDKRIVFVDSYTGEKRELRLSEKYCPNPNCKYYQQKNKGNIKFRTKYGIHKDRAMLICTECGERFSETKNTAYFNIKKPIFIFFSTLRHLAYNDGIRDTGRKVRIHRDTVMRYLARAGKQCVKTNILLKTLKALEIQLDEFWCFIKKKDKNISESEKNSILGSMWTWIALDPKSKFVIAHFNGKRTEESCLKFLTLVKERTYNGTKYFSSDELKTYAGAIKNVFGKLVTPDRTGKRGRPPKAKMELDDNIFYAILHKIREKGKVTDIKTKYVYGSKEKIDEIIENSPVSNTINTSFVERKNLDIRQTNRRATRKTQSFSKKAEMHNYQMDFTITFGNFCKKHSSIGQSPAMAIGITKHIWSIEELMSYTAT